MTESQAIHLIEQFATQCPLAIWILDSRGVAVFANGKLHDMLGILESPSGAIGINLFEDPIIEELGLHEHVKKLLQGDAVNATVEIKNPSKANTEIESSKSESLNLRLIGYPLFSSTQKIEHFVIFLEDITQTHDQREELRDETEDIKLFLKSKESRLETLITLKEEAMALEKEIKDLGGKLDPENP